MFTRSILCSNRLAGVTINNNIFSVPAVGLKYFPPPKEYDIEVPPDSRGKRLPILPKVPQYPSSLKPFKMQKKLRLMRGEELVLNKLLHKQYGVISLTGGRLKYGHLEMIRWTCNKRLPSNAFVLWRVDAPWQPITKKGQGQRMGGGKGAIDHYVTPLKARRVIIEVGGPVEYAEVKKCLEEIAHKLPFKAMAVTEEKLNQIQADEKYIEENNENPFSFKYIIQNNLGGCHKWIAPIDKYWFGKYN